MKRFVFVVLSLVVLLSLVVPTALANYPPKPYADAYVNVQVTDITLLNPPKGDLETGSSGVFYIQGTVVYDIYAAAKGPYGTAEVSGYADNYLWASAGQGVSFDATSIYLSGSDKGKYPKAKVNQDGTLTVVVAVPWKTGSSPGELYVWGYSDSIGSAEASWVPCKGMGKYDYDFDYSELFAHWCFKVRIPSEWHHLAENKLIIHNNVEGRIIELSGVGLVPDESMPRDSVMRVGANELFCSKMGEGGGCGVWEWTPKFGLKLIADFFPTGTAGQVEMWIDLPVGAPAGSHTSYGTMVTPYGTLMMDPVWVVANNPEGVLN